VTITNDEIIGTALQKMLSHQIMSLPVLDSQTKKTLHILSLAQLVEFLLDHYSPNDFSIGFITKLKNYLGMNKSQEFMNTPIRQLEPKMEIAHETGENDTLELVLNKMVETKAHRVLVMNDDGDLVNIISQSRLIQLISHIVDSIPQCLQSLRELNLGFKSVVCVLDTEPSYEAFRIMKERKLSGIAVINSLGILVGNISLSDLKLIGFDANYWGLMSQSVASYLAAIRAKPKTKIRSHVFAVLEDHNSKYPLVIKCRPYHTFGFIIRMFAYYRVHRIYVVDDRGTPLGIITLTDVLQELNKMLAFV